MSTTQSVEDYLKAIYIIQSEGGQATTKNIASALSVSAASVTNMFKRLAGLKLITHRSYQGAELTEAGTKIALEIIRHHRLLELYLKEMLGYSWDEVHDEAEHLEHHISEQFGDTIAELLNHPTHDPHGDPIPTKEGEVPEMASLAIADAELNVKYIIGRVRDQEPELLRYLEKMGIIPGVEITVLEKTPFDGPVRITIEGDEKTIGNTIAKSVFLMEPV